VGVNAGVVISFALFAYVFSLRLADGIIQSGGVKVKGLTVVIILAILLAGLALFDQVIRPFPLPTPTSPIINRPLV